MELEKKQVEVEWYDNPGIVTNIIIALIAVIIILSQSFAINNNLSTETILRSIINHNSVYLIVLVYFVALKTKIGKKYFDFLNAFLILLYFITGLTSILTLFQSFSLETFIGCLLHIILFLYLFHILFRRSRVWREFHLKKSPFNEIKNDAYFYAIFILAVLLLAIDLIATTTFDGTVLALLDALYIILFARYIYLYGCFLDNKEKKIRPVDSVEEIKEKVDEVKDKLDEVVEDIKDTVEEKGDLKKEKVKKTSKKNSVKKSNIRKNNKKKGDE
ncbi:MAG TPA: hypothetical protein IAB35_02545 [Candidatus Faecimonas gallistercoris]|nr:hypothetical protein [Candidatus Faecimonas gallistercoris]